MHCKQFLVAISHVFIYDWYLDILTDLTYNFIYISIFKRMYILFIAWKCNQKCKTHQLDLDIECFDIVELCLEFILSMWRGGGGRVGGGVLTSREYRQFPLIFHTFETKFGNSCVSDK